MSTDVQAHPLTVELATLQDQLQRCWESYLGLLDEYTACLQSIQEHFASGFFSLAQANARTTVGRRYGQDWFDDRTKATMRVVIESSEEKTSTGRHNLRFVEQKQYKPASVRASTSKAAPTESQEAQLPVPKANGEDESVRQLQKDPLSWYGLMSPRALRDAQNSFRATLAPAKDAIDGTEDALPPLERAIGAARAMRELEFTIRKLRKSIRQLERSAPP